MRTYTQNKPVGTDAATDYMVRQQSRANLELQIYDSTTVKVEHTTRGVRLHAKQTPKSSGGMVWQSPKELDPTVAVAAGTFVYISPGNPLVTSGLMDLVALRTIASPPGIWQAIKSVPAQVTVSGVVKYNVPQLPYPGATGATSGTPLKGDLDGPNLFWVQWSGAPICF